ncbi:MAG: response regulator [Nitrospiraceae bacterium]
MRVLLVEDQIDIRQLFQQVIRARGHEVTACADGESAWEAYQQGGYELLLLDWELRGGGMDGIQLCRQIRADLRGDRCVIVMVTAHDSADSLRQALQAGVTDYLVKPIGIEFLKLRLAIAEQWVEDVRRRFEAEDQAQALQSQLADQGQFHDLVGRSAAMVNLFTQIQEVAAVDATVLIEGETGTGKELVARAIHLSSRRKHRPFIAVNCADFTESSPKSVVRPQEGGLYRRDRQSGRPLRSGQRRHPVLRRDRGHHPGRADQLADAAGTGGDHVSAK